MKTIDQHIKFITENYVPKFNIDITDTFKEANQRLEDYNSGKVKELKIEALPEDGATVYASEEFPGVALEVVPDGNGGVKSYTFFLRKFHCVICLDEETPAMAIKGEFALWAAVDSTDLRGRELLDHIEKIAEEGREFCTIPYNENGPFTISADDKPIYKHPDGNVAISEEEYYKGTMIKKMETFLEKF